MFKRNSSSPNSDTHLQTAQFFLDFKADILESVEGVSGRIGKLEGAVTDLKQSNEDLKDSNKELRASLVVADKRIAVLEEPKEKRTAFVVSFRKTVLSPVFAILIALLGGGSATPFLVAYFKDEKKQHDYHHDAFPTPVYVDDPGDEKTI